MAEDNTNNKSSQNRSRNSNRRRRRPQNKNNNKETNRPTNNAQKATANKPSGNHKRRRPNKKNRRNRPMGPGKLLLKHDNLLEQYLVARKKFFELHGCSKTAQLDKAEKNYQNALRELRQFEDGLKDWQAEIINKKIDGLPKDTQYTSEHDLPEKAELVPFTGDFDDIHRLPTQIPGQYKDDTEESSGTMEDYLAYKGLTE